MRYPIFFTSRPTSRTWRALRLNVLQAALNYALMVQYVFADDEWAVTIRRTFRLGETVSCWPAS